MFIVIVGAAVAGIIGMIGIATKSSADPLIRKQALSIAEAMLEEVRLQPFTVCDADELSGGSSPSGTVTFVASAKDQANSGDTTLAINKPAGTAQNDVMIASVAIRPNSATVTPPSGWTLVRRTDSTSGTSNSLLVYRKVAGASEPGSYTWILDSGHTGAGGGIESFSGVDTANPINVEAYSTGFATYWPQTPSVTTTVANAMVVASYSISNGNTWENPPPSGMTQGFQATGGSEMIQANYALQASAGATGTKTAHDLGPDSADGGNSHILALKPGGCTESMGPEAGESRYSLTSPFDHVNDYNGFDSNTAVPSGIRNLDGTLIPGLDGYRVTVAVTDQPFGGIGDDTSGKPQSLLITVTVTGPGNTSVAVSGYRTRYAPNALP